MSLRWVARIYNYSECYLYEIIEDYKESKSDEQKQKIFSEFCDTIWASNNKRRIYTKHITYTVSSDVIDTPIGRIFDIWTDIPYTYYKSVTDEGDWCSIIRQKINNLYTIYCDKRVILNKAYMDLLKTPKRLYYRWLSGESMTESFVTESIDCCIVEAEDLKTMLAREKMGVSWGEYKEFVNGVLLKCFNKCHIISEYENNNELSTRLDFLTEDHSFVSYICRYLECEMRQYQKKFYGVRPHKKYKRCKSCGALIENTGNKKTFCESCAKSNIKDSWRRATNKYKKSKNHKIEKAD